MDPIYRKIPSRVPGRAGSRPLLVAFSLIAASLVCTPGPTTARAASDADMAALMTKVVGALATGPRTEETAPRDVFLSPTDCKDADTEMSLPLALHLRDRLGAALQEEGLRLQRPDAGVEDFWVLQCHWRRKEDRLAVTFAANLWTGGTQQKAKVVQGWLDLDPQIANLLEPDLASYGRTLVHRLALNDKLTEPKRVYLRPLQVSDIVGGKGSNEFFNDWLRQAIQESNLLIAVHAEEELAALDRPSLRMRGIRPRLSLAADLVDAQNELSGKVDKKDGRIEVATVLQDPGRATLAEASVNVPIEMLPPEVVQDLEASPADAIEAKVPVSKGGLHLELATTHGEGKASYRSGEQIVFLVRVDQDAFVYLFDLDSEGRATLLYPAFDLAETRLPAGQQLLLPDDGMPYELEVTPPFGRDLVWAVATDKPLAVPRQLEGDWGRAEVLTKRVREQSETMDAYAETELVLETLAKADAPAAGQADAPAGGPAAPRADIAAGDPASIQTSPAARID